MGDSGITRRQIGEGVVMITESIKGPPAVYRYSVEPLGFKKITFKFNFEGSQNFELSGDGVEIDPAKPLEATVRAAPFQQSPYVTCQQVDKKKGGSLSMTMSWTLEHPEKETCKAYSNNFYGKLAEIVKDATSAFPVELLEMGLEKIEEQCLKLGSKFVDCTFPPSKKSLFDSDNGREFMSGDGEADDDCNGKYAGTIVWRRPTEFAKEGETYTIFEGKVEPDDIKQGMLGDCWLMCALSSIAEFPLLVEALFKHSKHPFSEHGVYKVRLCKNGEWVTVTVDDYIPCFPEGGPIYSRANGTELWVMLVEKAFAKLHGSYSQIKSGWPFEAMIDLTGAPYKDIRFHDRDISEKIANGSLWRYLCDCDQNNFIMSCSSGGVDTMSEGTRQKTATGIIPGHAYTLLTCINTSSGHRLCKLRNPWGSLEWNGDWSDNSPLWTEVLKAEVGFVQADDGDFWMCFEDLVKHFIGINVCMVRHPELNSTPWHESRHRIKYKFDSNAELVDVKMFVLNVAQDDTELYASVHQRDKRIIGSMNNIDVGIAILKVTPEGKYDYVNATGNSVERQNQLESKGLKAGQYIVIPTSTGGKIQQLKQASSRAFTEADFHRSCVVVFHSTKPYTVEEMPFNRDAYEEAMLLPAIHDGTPTDLFGDGSIVLYTHKSGYAGISYVVNNTTENDPIMLTLDFTGSENIVSSRGALSADVVITPGNAKVMHHIVPANDSIDWSCGWNCNARWLTDEEMKEISEKEVVLKLN
jgi:calpain-15